MKDYSTNPPNAINSAEPASAAKTRHILFDFINMIIDRDLGTQLTAIEIGVLLVHARHASPAGESFPSTLRIARFFGHTSDSHVRRARAHLVELGFLQIVDAGGGNRAATYRLLIPGANDAPPADSAPGRIPHPGAESAREGARIPPKRGRGFCARKVTMKVTMKDTGRARGFFDDAEEIQKEIANRVKSANRDGLLPCPEPVNGTGKHPGPAEPAGFAKFWASWPRHQRKTGKAECLKRWTGRHLEDRSGAILSSLEWFKTNCSDWLKNGGEFIPMPLTWLNKAPWETEPTELQVEMKETHNGNANSGRSGPNLSGQYPENIKLRVHRFTADATATGPG